MWTSLLAAKQEPPPRGVGLGGLPYEESYPFHHLGPLVAMREKALLCRFGRTGDEPPTEARHLSDRGSHFGGVYPPLSPLLGLSRSWQQDTETALVMLQWRPWVSSS